MVGIGILCTEVPTISNVNLEVISTAVRDKVPPSISWSSQGKVCIQWGVDILMV
jgi:hypothetical protein